MVTCLQLKVYHTIYTKLDDVYIIVKLNSGHGTALVILKTTDEQSEY